MTSQQFFVDTINHLIKQGRAMDDEGVCLYRTPEGKSCAAGRWIADDLYQPMMEGKDIQGLIDKALIPRDHILKVKLILANELQLIHDSNINWASDTCLSQKGWFHIQWVVDNHNERHPEDQLQFVW